MKLLSISLLTVLVIGSVPTVASAAGPHQCRRYSANQRSSCLRNVMTDRLRRDQVRYYEECGTFMGMEKLRCMRYGPQFARDNRLTHRWNYLQYAKAGNAMRQPKMMRENPIDYRLQVHRCMEDHADDSAKRRGCIRKARHRYE